MTALFYSNTTPSCDAVCAVMNCDAISPMIIHFGESRAARYILHHIITLLTGLAVLRLAVAK